MAIVGAAAHRAEPKWGLRRGRSHEIRSVGLRLAWRQRQRHALREPGEGVDARALTPGLKHRVEGSVVAEAASVPRARWGEEAAREYERKKMTCVGGRR